MSTLKIQLGEDKFSIETNSPYSILAICKRNQINIPHSCCEGRCGLCKAILTEGKVVENMTSGLSPELRGEKYILTCQSKLNADLVCIDVNFKS